MEKKNLEEMLKSEGKKFAPNVLSDVYEKLGIEFSCVQENKEVEAKLQEEGKRFVKNNYEDISKEVSFKKKIQPGFLAFIKNPITISIIASLLVGVIATSILIPVLLNNPNASLSMQEKIFFI